MPDSVLALELNQPLFYEIESAASLLGHGVNLLSERGQYSGEASPILAILATGSEKLLKLSIGLLAFHETDQWPAFDTMKSFGHGIVPMHNRTMADFQRLLADPATAGVAGSATRALALEVAEDEVLGHVLRCLSEYAEQGRFHNLDRLGRRAGLGPSPKERWEQLEAQIMDSDPALQRTLGTPEFSTIGLPGVKKAIGSAVVRWWSLHQRAWNTGVIGRTAQVWSGILGYDVPSDLGRL